jgi:hypothetical protein
VKRLKVLETENAGLRNAVSDLTLDKVILQEAAKGKPRTPPCLGADRRYRRAGVPVWLVWLPQIAALLRDAGMRVNEKRVERIWRREGLKVPKKQPKRGRLWLADGSCLRLRPQHKIHPTRRAGIHPIRQSAGVPRQGDRTPP